MKKNESKEEGKNGDKLKKRGGLSSILSLCLLASRGLDFLPVVSYPCGPEVCKSCMSSVEDRNNNILRGPDGADLPLQSTTK